MPTILGKCKQKLTNMQTFASGECVNNCKYGVYEYRFES